MTNAVSMVDLRRAAKLPAKQAGGGTVAAFFEANKASMAAVLPQHVSPERMLKVALGAVRSNPKLLECTTESLFGASLQLAQLGLEPNTPMQHAFLIPFNNKRANRTDVQVVIGYRGFLDLARRSGQIVSIAAHEVCAKDKFDFEYGLEERLSHRPTIGERGEVIAFYAVAKLVGGGYAFEVMSRQAVDAIRDASQGYRTARQYGRTDHPWITHYTEMGRKSAIRRIFKYLPISVELATAVALDGLAEANRSQGLENVLTGEWSVVSYDQDQDQDQNQDQNQDQGPVLNRVADPEPTTTTTTRATATEPRDKKGTEYPQRSGDTWLDAAGETFDQARHGWNRDQARPAVNSDGTFRARRGAANGGDQPPAPAQTPAQTPAPAPAPADEADMFGGIE